MKKILVILLIGTLLATNAFAGRFGGGRSSGMQRRITSNNMHSNSAYSQPNTHSAVGGSPVQQQQRSGMGAGTAAMLGAAAGAAGGYMLGKSGSNDSSNTNASGGVVNEARESSIPWGTIAILIAILALGLMFFRKKTKPGMTSGNIMSNFTSNAPTNFSIPNLTRTPGNSQSNKTTGRAGGVAQTVQLDKMPDGVETVYFLRQAKGMFLHIQSMNNADNLGEIQKYMTAQLFADTKDEIAQNPVLADFSNLDCQLLQSEAVEARQSEDGVAIEAQLVASVKFFGNVSENPELPAQPFSEIWNFIKSASTNNKWVVAGIQQEALPS